MSAYAMMIVVPQVWIGLCNPMRVGDVITPVAEGYTVEMNE